MARFKVKIIRTSIDTAFVTVDASNKAEAIRKTDDMDLAFEEGPYEYAHEVEEDQKAALQTALEEKIRAKVGPAMAGKIKVTVI